jgi:hypothetical protein
MIPSAFPRFMEVKRHSVYRGAPVHGGQKAARSTKRPGSWRSKGSGHGTLPRFMEVKRLWVVFRAPVHGGQKAPAHRLSPGSWRSKGL